ncbi:hypothetical protein EVAR_60455_1 [Eumeta japonica]|uniref:Uncharacterized protein n=1 Tax=Eumeta variegata TaxID=151549 RepID=A0A4C1Z6D2_EUMVA|nr:hypothetical protein EVAR_60455_1 [Eumeta japonica]
MRAIRNFAYLAAVIINKPYEVAAGALMQVQLQADSSAARSTSYTTTHASAGLSNQHVSIGDDNVNGGRFIDDDDRFELARRSRATDHRAAVAHPPLTTMATIDNRARRGAAAANRVMTRAPPTNRGAAVRPRPRGARAHWPPPPTARGRRYAEHNRLGHIRIRI